MSTLSWKCSRRRPRCCPLVAEELRHREPAHRLAQRVGARATIRANVGVISGRSATSRPPLSVEVVELADDLVAALPRVQLERLQRRAVVLDERVPARYGPPGTEDVRARASSSG
jgi:hypothetical protein